MERSELVTFHGARGNLATRLKAAHMAGLLVREITHGSNGYPEPFDGEFFVSGFDNFAAAEKFAAENDGEVGSARWKKGWHEVEGFAREFTPLSVTGDLAGLLIDDCEIATAGERRGWLAGELSRAKDEEEIESFKRQIEALKEYGDAELLLLDGGDVRESFDCDDQMSISYDVRNIEIGVRLQAEVDEDEDD